jgi:hypothetical protein
VRLPQQAGDLTEGDRQQIAAWKRFAHWGELISKERNRSLALGSADWEPVRLFIRSFEELADQERNQLTKLLHDCDERFHPLADPLRLTLTDHRWLDPQREREESYSDWLCWLINRLDSSEKILSLFGLEDTEFGRSVRKSRPISCTREVCIPCASEGRKRLDLVVEFEDGAILLVEVKIRSLDLAGGRENLPLYLEWLKKKQPDQRFRAAVLLLNEQEMATHPGWIQTRWDELALQLRYLACELRSSSGTDLLFAAMMLSFSAAAEQNLLGISASGAGFTAPQTTLYLERFLRKQQS